MNVTLAPEWTDKAFVPPNGGKPAKDTEQTAQALEGAIPVEPEGDRQWRAPQPIVIALAELKTLLNEGRTMLAKYQVEAAPNPTFLEVEDYSKRTRDAARQQVFGLTPKQLATFEQPWDEEEFLLAQAEMLDHGFIKDGSPDMAIYRHLWSRVKRLNELISLIESK